MPSATPQKALPLERILVIDDLPLIPLAFREIFRSINPAAQVEYSESIYNALSASVYEAVQWHLIILGSNEEAPPGSLLLPVAELKDRFPSSRLMIFSSVYDPQIVDKVHEAAIGAYVHRQEPVDEILLAGQHLSAGQPYLSGMFRTLYYDYGLGRKK
jgi:DNA-binding NarL/FixJ family response regulator